MLSSVIISFLAIVLIILLAIVGINYKQQLVSLFGVQYEGEIDYDALKNTINGCYLCNSYIRIGQLFNVFTRSISHHSLYVLTDSQNFIISRISNLVQVLAVAEEDVDNGYIIGYDGYKYDLLEAVDLTGIALKELIDYGKSICESHTYSLFNHNCQEFVYMIMNHYGVISSDGYVRKIKKGLLAQGISELMNN